MRAHAAIAQSVEHVIGNDEVIGPNPISSSIKRHRPIGRCFFAYKKIGKRNSLADFYCVQSLPFTIFNSVSKEEGVVASTEVGPSNVRVSR